MTERQIGQQQSSGGLSMNRTSNLALMAGAELDAQAAIVDDVVSVFKESTDINESLCNSIIKGR